MFFPPQIGFTLADNIRKPHHHSIMKKHNELYNMVIHYLLQRVIR